MITANQFSNAIRNIYFCFRETDKGLDYSIIVNVDEKDKPDIYNKEIQGYKVVKVLANE
jgi:hypothetical protein